MGQVNRLPFCLEHFPDDAAVTDETLLFRRIPPKHVYFDENENRFRPSSAAFEDDGDGDPMSAHLSSVLVAEAREPVTLLAGHEGYSLASITAALARSKSQTVHPDPLPAESAHAVVCGEKERGKKNAPKRVFALQAQWAVFNQPPQAPAE